MRTLRLLLAFVLLFPMFASAQKDAASVGEELKKLNWQIGPTEGHIGSKATIKIPDGYVFLDESNTSKFLELNGNPPQKGHYTVAPRSLAWFSVFSFDESGYVKDDEKIDADALLKSIKESDGPSNEERSRLGMTSITTVGWEVPPHYDSATKRLEWGMRLRSGSGAEIINYTSRLLGRTGVMSAILVSDQGALAANTADFNSVLQKFDYVPGEKYSEFKSGDKIAEYGLAALILGGAAAVATKKGFWAVIVSFFAAFWKLLIAAFVAGGAFIRKLFNREKELMPLSAEILLMAAAIGLYLYDSVLLLYANEGVLVPGRAGRWRAHFGFRHATIFGKRIFVPNPLLPHRPVFRLVWAVAGERKPDEQSWAENRQPFRVMGPLIWCIAVGWFVLLPAGLFSRFGDDMLLLALAIIYSGIIAALAWVWRQRVALRLTNRQCLGLAFDALVCSPFALNLSRKISARMNISEDFMHAAQRLLDAEQWSKARSEIIEQLGEEMEGEEDGSPHKAQLKRHRDNLLQQMPPCQPQK